LRDIVPTMYESLRSRIHVLLQNAFEPQAEKVIRFAFEIQTFSHKDPLGLASHSSPRETFARLFATVEEIDNPPIG
jgi:hypothetical protein